LLKNSKIIERKNGSGALRAVFKGFDKSNPWTPTPRIDMIGFDKSNSYTKAAGL